MITVREDQIEPQPRAAPVRPAGSPVRRARIFDFRRDDAGRTYTLRFELEGKTHSVQYTIRPDGTYAFTYTNGAGGKTTEIYRRLESRRDSM